MESTTNSSPKETRNAKIALMMRNFWLILTGISSVMVLMRMYRWSNGQDALNGIYAPLGFMAIGLAILMGSQNKILYYGLILLAIILIGLGMIGLFTA